MLNFSRKLVDWYYENKRILPWRSTDNPYFIWLSEVLLQQTRVEQGLEYYNNFICRFPEIKSLAEANEEEILKLWQGLGYYSRARNLHFASKQIINNYNGRFPDKYEDILKLKGVGLYSAAAIASIAFNLPYPVIDGNVLRVISRIFGIQTPVDSTLGKKEINAVLFNLIDKKNPGTFNQALMELGALVCKPQNPLCEDCVFISECYAYKMKSIAQFPVKSKIIKQRNRFFYYLVITTSERNENYIYINKRIHQDIWKNLYDFLLIETGDELSFTDNSILKAIVNFLNTDNFTIKSISSQHKHKLSHQTIYAYFIELQIDSIKELKVLENYYKINAEDLSNYPIPKLIENYIEVSNKKAGLKI